MSRSRRKPIFKDGYKSKARKIAKGHANRAVRNSDELASGKQYKKQYCSWNIYDFIFDCRWDDTSQLTPRQKALKVRK